MTGSSAVFDYPIKRPYPWRFTTSLISVASALVLGALVYFNLAVVGLTSTSYSSTTFVETQVPSWTDRMNLKTVLNKTTGCDSTTLVSGGIYKTQGRNGQNGVFAYTLDSISVIATGEEISTLAYDGFVLENCTIVSMEAFGEYSNSEVNTETRINCTLAEQYELGAVLNIALSSGYTATRQMLLPSGPKLVYMTKMSRVAGQLLRILALDVGNDFVLTKVAYQKPLDSCSLYIVWESIERFIFSSQCNGDFPDNLMEISTSLLDNFAQVLWSAVLLDLGVNSPYNRLSVPELMSQSLHTHINSTALRTHYSIDSVDGILANMTSYGLPLEESQPVQFNAGYLCHKMWWKTPTNLVIDVSVATISLFMAYWTVLNFVLRYLATRSHPHRNYCVRPSCNELPYHSPISCCTYELRSLSSGTPHKSAPTRSQSTPP